MCQIGMENKMEKQKLMNWISMVSFSALDMAEYLDTHPRDTEAMDYYNHLMKLRNQAVRDYTSSYGPFVLDSFHPEDRWCWALQPWPWEGGC